MSIVFTDKDRQELAVRGITEGQILTQIEIFEEGIPPAKLIKPCTVGDGITVINKAEENRLIKLCQNAAASGRTRRGRCWSSPRWRWRSCCWSAPLC